MNLRTILEAVADHLEADKNRTVYMPQYRHYCGTAACIMGWAAELIPFDYDRKYYLKYFGEGNALLSAKAEHIANFLSRNSSALAPFDVDEQDAIYNLIFRTSSQDADEMIRQQSWDKDCDLAPLLDVEFEIPYMGPDGGM